MGKSEWGELFGGLIKHAIQEGVAAVKEELAPIIAEAKRSSQSSQEDGSTEVLTQSKPVVVTEAQPAASPTDTMVTYLSAVEAARLISAAAWTDSTDFSLDKEEPMRWLKENVQRAVEQWVKAFNEVPVLVHDGDSPEPKQIVEPMTGHEGAFALGLVFAGYVYLLSNGDRHQLRDCAASLKQWFDQGVAHYERTRKRRTEAGPLSGG